MKKSRDRHCYPLNLDLLSLTDWKSDWKEKFTNARKRTYEKKNIRQGNKRFVSCEAKF